MNIDKAAFVANTEDRCPCGVFIDESGSMAGEKIDEVNKSLPLLYDGIRQDPLAVQRVELAVAGFSNDEVRLLHDFATVDACKPPTLAAHGNTPIGKAINFGLDLLGKRKDVLRANQIGYYRPWLFLITDGEPTDDEWQVAAQRIHAEEAAKKVAFFVVGVDGANMATLSQIAPPGRPPMKLTGLKFAELFVWLSTSLTRASTATTGGQVALPAAGWGTVHN